MCGVAGCALTAPPGGSSFCFVHACGNYKCFTGRAPGPVNMGAKGHRASLCGPCAAGFKAKRQVHNANSLERAKKAKAKQGQGGGGQPPAGEWNQILQYTRTPPQVEKLVMAVQARWRGHMARREVEKEREAVSGAGGVACEGCW